MSLEAIERDRVGDQEFSLFRADLPGGRVRFIAKTLFADGEVVLIDHWNLAVLQRQIREVIPVMTLARELR